MAAHRPLVIFNGRIQQMPTGDTLTGDIVSTVHYGLTPPVDTSLLWINTYDLTLNVYYNDGSSSSWVVVGGPEGPVGETGPGVVAGGTVGQVLVKQSGVDYDTAWQPKIQTLETKASTSGTSVFFENIPSWVQRITVSFVGVSTNGSSPLLLQLGTIAGYVATGYSAAASGMGTTVDTANETTGFRIEAGAALSAAGSIRHGKTTFERIENNVWSAAGQYIHTNSALSSIHTGTINLAATLTRLRVIALNQTDAFDGGSITVRYE